MGNKNVISGNLYSNRTCLVACCIFPGRESRKASKKGNQKTPLCMKKIVLTIYHNNASKTHIRFVMRLLCKIAGVQMIEISETDVPETKINNNY